MINKFHAWHQAKLGLFVFGLLELAIAYAFISLAIDRGSLWYYVLALVFLVGSLQNFFKLIGKLFHASRKR